MTYFECVFDTLLNSFLFNFYMIFIYFILKKIKKNFVKKDKYIGHLTRP